MILAAAGLAKRFKSGYNKVWAELGGKSLLERTISVFDSHPLIGMLVVVVGDDEKESALRLSTKYSKAIHIVHGGPTRALSVLNGLNALPDQIKYVLVHDAARPLVSPELISRTLIAVIQFGAALPGLPISDTVKRVDEEGVIRETVPRKAVVNGVNINGMTSVQTPQGARVELLREAYSRYDFSGQEPTDEASLLEAINVEMITAPGDPDNIKITHPEDMQRAEKILGYRAAFGEYRTGFGYDVHSFATKESGRPLYLGGVKIPRHQGLEGHSDADVLLHAVCDALLGAASLGDIGILFPNTDPAYQNISSLKLLSEVHRLLREEGWRIGNIDAAVVAETPKISPYRAMMQKAIADCLGVEESRISIKATTSEKMGFLGRGEGIACSAVATIQKSDSTN